MKFTLTTNQIITPAELANLLVDLSNAVRHTPNVFSFAAFDVQDDNDKSIGTWAVEIL